VHVHEHQGEVPVEAESQGLLAREGGDDEAARSLEDGLERRNVLSPIVDDEDLGKATVRQGGLLSFV
jgi:hypothetical protein